MNFDKLNQWLTLLANFGVLAGILFLSVEVGQNTQMMRTQTRNAITENIVSAGQPAAENPYTADIFFRGNIGEIDPSSGSEWLSYNTFVNMQLRNWENEWYQYQQGLFEEEEFEPRLRTWRAYFEDYIGFRVVWEIGKSGFSSSFQEQIDEAIDGR